jgi:hypothetical protein
MMVPTSICLYRTNKLTSVTVQSQKGKIILKWINPSMPELNPSAQCCLTRFLMGILLLEPCI